MQQHALIQGRLRHTCLSQAEHSGSYFRSLEHAAPLSQRGKMETKFFQLSFLNQLHAEASARTDEGRRAKEKPSGPAAQRLSALGGVHPPVQPQSLWAIKN